jgi:hypothetical protein
MGRVGVGRENVLVGVRGRKTSPKDSRCGSCAYYSRPAPFVRRDTSPWEGTMGGARDRGCAVGLSNGCIARKDDKGL